MKKLTLSTLLFFIAVSSAIAQQLVFIYDAAGNQTERKWICINCNPPVLGAKNTDGPIVDQVSKTDKAEELKITGKNRMVTAYPNPVSETLHVDWKTNEKDLFVKTIDIYSLLGVKLQTRKFSLGQNETQFTFSNLPPATYLLIVTYSDNKRETIKIIKL